MRKDRSDSTTQKSLFAPIYSVFRRVKNKQRTISNAGINYNRPYFVCTLETLRKIIASTELARNNAIPDGKRVYRRFQIHRRFGFASRETSATWCWPLFSNCFFYRGAWIPAKKMVPTTENKHATVNPFWKRAGHRRCFALSPIGYACFSDLYFGDFSRTFPRARAKIFARRRSCWSGSITWRSVPRGRLTLTWSRKSSSRTRTASNRPRHVL